MAKHEPQEITVVITEETRAVYKVPVSRLRDLQLPTTRDQLADTDDLQHEDIDEEMLMDAIDGIEPAEYAVQERQISFPTTA